MVKIYCCKTARDIIPLVLVSVLILLLTVGGFLLGCTTSNKMLSLRDVTNALEKEGLRLQKDMSLSPSDYEVQGIKPIIYKLDTTSCNLFVYVYQSYEDREKAYSHGSSEIKLRSFFGQDSKWCMFYQTRNVFLAAAVPKEVGSSPQILHNLELIKEVVFKRLNDGKQLLFKGEGSYWESEISLKYYEHWWVDNKGVTQYDSYHNSNPMIKYKGTDFSSIGEVRYSYLSRAGSGGSASKLDKDGCIRGSGIGGNGAFEREDDVLTMTVEWDGKKETFELRVVSKY